MGRSPRGSRSGGGTHFEAEAAKRGVHLPVLRRAGPVLLELSMRLSDLQGLHDGEPLGHDLQPGSLDVPGLRPGAPVRESVSGLWP